MVVGTEMSSSLADVIFAIEGTAINGAYMNDIRTNYLIPTIEYFSQGFLNDEREFICDESTSALYGIVIYHAADRLPSPCTDIHGPYSNPHRLLQMLDKLELVGGRGESHANVAEALATSLVCFDDMQLRRDTNVTPQKHCILICNSPPYLMPVAENQTYAGSTAEQLAMLFNERNVNLTILSARKIPAMFKLFEKAGGDLSSLQTKNYAKDPRHLVLLKGYSLKERPVSPGVAHAMGNVAGTQNTVPVSSAVGGVVAGAPVSRYPVYAAPAGGPPRPSGPQRWQMPMQAPRPPPQFSQVQAHGTPSSALIEQLTRPPSTIVPPFSNSGMTMAQQQQVVAQQQMRLMSAANMGAPNPAMAAAVSNQGNVPPNMTPTPAGVPAGMLAAGNQGLIGGTLMGSAQQPNPNIMVQNPNQPMMGQMPPQPPGVLNQPSQLIPQGIQNSMIPTSQPQAVQPQNREKVIIWRGVVEWIEKTKNGNDGQKLTRQAPSQVSASQKDGEPELKADSWPQKLIMQLMPKTLIGSIGGAYVKNSKSVTFHFQPCESLDSLTKVMSSGFAGCVHFTAVPCEIKVLLLVYTAEKQAYLGFIPNDQTAFVERLRKVIQQQKITSSRCQPQQPLVPGGMAGPPGGPSGPGGLMPGGNLQPGGSAIQPTVQPVPARMQPGMPPVSGGGGVIPPNLQQTTSGMPPSLSQGNPNMPANIQPNAPGLQPGMQPAPGSGIQPTPTAGLTGGLKPGGGPIQGSIASASGLQGGIPSGLQQPSAGIQAAIQNSQQDSQNSQNNQFTEAARQENLKQMQRLQLALEASQQQELQYKQLEFMNQIKIQHLQDPSQITPQQVQLEEQHKLRAQLQQLQQQTAAGQQRLMRPAIPNNPGLKHLLQQPHYRMQVGQQMRPVMQQTNQPSVPQQFDDVPYDFL